MSKNGARTRKKIIKVAERLLVDRGLDCSLRTIMNEAGVNVAAVHYHFGNRQKLIEEIIRDHANEITEERLRRLDEAMSKKRASLKDVVEAFVLPVYEYEQKRGSSRYVATLLGRIHASGHPELQSLAIDAFSEGQTRFLDILRQLLPSLTEKEVYWRHHAVVAVISSSMATPERSRAFSNGLCDPKSIDDAREILIPLIVNMLKTKPVVA